MNKQNALDRLRKDIGNCEKHLKESAKMSNTTTSVSEFILQCSIESNQKTITIYVLGFIYFTSVFGNLLVILVIILNHQLHAPMYIYIGTLAVIDLANGSILIPKMLSVLLLDSSVVPYAACVLQMFLLFHVEEMESLLLAFMAFDRYVAVIYPLRYPSLITNKRIAIGILVTNIVGLILKSPILFFVGELSFCHTNILPFCFCDYGTIVRVSCNEDPKYLTSLAAGVATTGAFPLFLILLSYIRIVIEALKISSAGGRSKIFSTCLTHLVVVGLFYIPLLLSYILSGAGATIPTESYNIMFILGNVMPPMMNPIIYSFRNKEINKSIEKLFSRKTLTPKRRE
ncbi:olfactory receptor 9Q1-like isoform X1 [Polypterus senegalus]|uniref:olfactory receptor 9Q1-like isoform X1 n=2 Tax=Polypterus senegalus TaxID=55291 RepID=UPI001965F744|nr:olfactory receptor 9Q1-like isoform X1 [Polypterus senegalus]